MVATDPPSLDPPHPVTPRPSASPHPECAEPDYERLLRTFVDDNAAVLTALAVDVDEFTTHLYRRTTATFVERAAGITLASRLLGHANEQITRASYVVSAVEVDPITIDILDAALGS